MLNILINGRENGSISPLDRGFQYGDGLFETLLVEFGCVTFLGLHLDRLKKGCKVLGFPAPDLDTIREELSQLVKCGQHGVIKIILSRGIGERGFMPNDNPEITRVVSFAVNDNSINQELASIGLALCETRLSHQPLLAGIKHLNQLERILARRELRENALNEGLMLDMNGSVIEGTMSNLFIVKKGVLMTPKLNNCGVSGVIRQFLIRQAGVDGIEFQRTELSLECIKNADEIFMTNSLMPVRSVNELIVDKAIISLHSSHHAQWAFESVLGEIQCQISGGKQ